MWYYIFWLKSSKGTDELVIRAYPQRPHQADLKAHCEAWCACFGAWTASEDHVNYGWRKIDPRSVPKNRWEAIKRFRAVYATFKLADDKRRKATLFLRVPPFSGEKVKKVSRRG